MTLTYLKSSAIYILFSVYLSPLSATTCLSLSIINSVIILVPEDTVCILNIKKISGTFKVPTCSVATAKKKKTHKKTKKTKTTNKKKVLLLEIAPEDRYCMNNSNCILTVFICQYVFFLKQYHLKRIKFTVCYSFFFMILSNCIIVTIFILQIFLIISLILFLCVICKP